MRTVSKLRRTAFTLVELLVVVSIIAILAALLLPALKSARDMVKCAVCKSNERQIGVRIMMYSQDNGGWLPAGNYNALSFSTPEDWVWNEAIWGRDFYNPKPSKNERGVMNCPSDPTVHPSYPENNTSYSANILLFEVMGNPPTGRHHKDAELRASLITVGEIWDWPTLLGRGNNVTNPAGASSFLPYPAGGGPNHFKGGNYLFSDGHVAWLLPDEARVKENGEYKYWKP